MEQIVEKAASYPVGKTACLTISMIVQNEGSFHAVIKPSTLQFRAISLITTKKATAY